MANSGTPRLKVYRLDEGYSQATDNDIQTTTDDEMVPVVEKNLNPFSAEEMVGVRKRQDARLVVEDSETDLIDVPVMLSSENGFIESIAPVCCEGWVLGKGNIDVYVYRQKTSDLGNGTLNGSAPVGAFVGGVFHSESNGLQQEDDFTAYPYNSQTDDATGRWIRLDRRFWDCTVESSHTYLSSSEHIPYLTEQEDTDEEHEMDWITFRIGNLLLKSNRFFQEGYANYVPIVSNSESIQSFGKIKVRYRKYHELDGDSGTRRVPFGNVYNGNKNGRCLTVGENQVHLAGGNDTVNNAVMNYREGNYLYRRGVYPFRVKKLSMSNGSTTVDCDPDWFMDDIMKPVVFEQIALDATRTVLKQLTSRQVSVQYQQSNGEDSYLVTLNPKYYKNASRYPETLFFAYNYVDDSIEDTFGYDFNYDYFNDGFRGSGIGYGFENRGIIGEYGLDTFTPLTTAQQIYVRRTAIVATSSLVHDIPLTVNGLTATFSLPEGANFSQIRLYEDGVLVDDSRYEVTESSGTVTVTWSDGEAPSEFLLVYYKEVPIVGIDSITTEGCIGVRLPCYEKVKSSTLFVSSFPNWLKGHVNNDLDVFYGNKLYSGTQLSGTSLVDYHDIYPCYIKDGWYAMYAEGAVEFATEQTENDYFDIFNYGVSTAVTSATDIAGTVAASTTTTPNYLTGAGRLMLEYYKVRYNVARHDGIYTVKRGVMTNYSNKNGVSRYALLDGSEYAVGKKWLRREDSVIRRVFECANDEIPKIIRVDAPESIANGGLSLLKDVVMSDGEIRIVGTDSDRVSLFSIPYGAHVVMVVPPTPTEAGEGDFASQGARIHVKVGRFLVGSSEQDCLAIGMESDPQSTTVGNLFDEDTLVEWAYLPDCEDNLIGSLAQNGESYDGVPISAVQTGTITIGGSPLAYWTDDESNSSSVVNGLAPVSGDAMLRRYRWRGDSVMMYDMFFEVMSYRYNTPHERAGEGVSCVELVAYRVVRK